MNNLEMISINSLDLSVRATNVLLALNIQNAYDLVRLDFIHILKAKNCGVKTAREIETAIKRFVNETTSENEPPLKRAPIFGSDPEEISALDLEALNWYEIEALSLNARAANVIKELKLKSIYELVQLDAARLLKRKNCGKKTIEDIRRALKNFILTQACGNEKGEIKKLQDCLDYLKALLLSPNNETILKQDRYKKVFIGRVGIGSRISTLEQIGKELSLTRERVRQIAKKVATICFNAMDYSTKKFFKEFVKSICDNGGLLALEKSELYTASSDEIKLFNFLLESRYGKVRFHSRLGIWSAVGARKFELLCDKIGAALKKRCLPGKIYGLTDIKDISSRLSDEIGIGCCDVEPVVRIVINDCFKLHGEGNYLFSRQAHNLGAIYEAVIRDFFPQGIAIYKDYSAFFDALAKFSPKIAKEMESNKRAMIVRATSAGNTVLWDWGVYIHKDNIHIDEKILHRTKKWILDQFGKGRDKISLWGAFSENEDAYLKAGIKNQYALYSCMKLKFPNEFAFLEAPYVQPRRSTARISRSEMLEKYLKQKNGPVEIERISKDLGLKEYQICQSFYYDEELSKKILPWGSWTFVHINNVSIEKQDLKEVVRFIKSAVTRHGHVNIKHAYDAKVVLCKKNDIPSPRALYALLKLNSTDGLYFPGFPHVMSEELAAVHDGRFSLDDIVEHFLSSKKQVLSYEELYDYFVKQRGYSRATVDNLPFFCSNIVKYTTGSYIALDAIEWTEEKSHELARIATKKFEEDGNLLARPFSYVNDLLELALPKINKKIDVSWQKALLCELLERIDNVKILGTYEEVFILSPNKFNVETIEDLIEFVLKTEFAGAANVNALVSKLSELRITKALGDSTKNDMGYKVEGEEVFILRGQS